MQNKQTTEVTFQEVASRDVNFSPNSLQCFSWNTTFFERLSDLIYLFSSLNVSIHQFAEEISKDRNNTKKYSSTKDCTNPTHIKSLITELKRMITAIQLGDINSKVWPVLLGLGLGVNLPLLATVNGGSGSVQPSLVTVETNCVQPYSKVSITIRNEKKIKNVRVFILFNESCGVCVKETISRYIHYNSFIEWYNYVPYSTTTSGWPFELITNFPYCIVKGDLQCIRLESNSSISVEESIQNYITQSNSLVTWLGFLVKDASLIETNNYVHEPLSKRSQHNKKGCPLGRAPMVIPRPRVEVWYYERFLLTLQSLVLWVPTLQLRLSAYQKRSVTPIRDPYHMT
ncbi:hypothetical protein BC833DRAFT_566387 [Globomyces pollinis-pini]|nr:hypothetical protein BC833DRAFT_566387 [Globomyces pollinis-pini]